MQELFPNATKEVADRSKWIEVATDRAHDSAVHLNTTFNKAAQEARAANDIPLVELYELLSQVFSMYFKGNDPNEPFGPMVQMGVSRTAIVTDFTDQNLSVLEHIQEKAGDPVVDARLADVLWLRRRNQQMAVKALDAYISHAEQCLVVTDENWLQAKQSLHRAAQLCKQLGQQKQHHDRLVAVVEKALDPNQPEPDNFYRVIILRVASEFGLFSDFKVWADNCHKLARTALQTHKYDKARGYWDGAIDLAGYTDDKGLQKIYREAQTDAYVEEARWFKSINASATIVSDRYSKAIEACRRLGGRRQLIDALHIEMIESQKKVLDELKRHEVSMDVTRLVELGTKAVEDVPLDQVLENIALMVSPQKKVNLRASAEKAAREFIFMHLVTGVTFNSKGRVVARTAPVVASKEGEKEAGIQAQMIIHASQEQYLTAVSQVEAARSALGKRIGVDSMFFQDLVTMNPWVPSGREEIYVKGLTAGLYGDWMNCAHLLIPQLENSLRDYMERSGLLVTRLTEEMTQKEYDLNRLLYEPATEKMFGEDLVFGMRVLLVEEIGGNYRNKLAHGLLDANHFHQGWVNYLWAMTIRLCWIGKVIVQEQHDKELANDEVDKTSPEPGGASDGQ
jgi:tetratricopeptide (TPR) repeat protein